MLLKVSHTTHYTFDKPVDYVLQQVRLTPLDNPQQKVLDWSVEFSGGHEELSFRDQHGNHTQLVQANEGVCELIVTARGTVETSASAGILGKVYGPVPLWHYLQQTPPTAPGSGIKALAKGLNAAKDPVEALHALSKRIIEQVEYNTGETYVETTAEAALKGGAGVCQDHAQIFISAARVAGHPARYVSGYLMMNDRVDQDATHGWAEVHLDDLGWVGFDVSNQISPDERYIRLAVGLDYQHAAPITGLKFGSGNESMIVSLQVQQ